MKERKIFCLALAGGALCAAARRLQLATAFESDLQLPRPWAPATIVLVLLLILCAVGLLVLSWTQAIPRTLRKHPELTLCAGEDGLFAGALITAALLMLIAAPLLLRDGWKLWSAYQAAKEAQAAIPGGDNGLITLLAGCASLLSCLALLLTVRSVYRGGASPRRTILLPVVTNCLWLLCIYRGHAANPVLWDYAPLLLAAVAGILFYLAWAGLCVGENTHFRTLFTAGLTVLLSAVALAGEWTLTDALLLTAQLIAALALLWRIPKTLRQPPDPPVQAEEKLEEETHE